MTPERAYRSTVLPLSGFLVSGGMILAVCFWVARVPITSPFPFIESETLNRHLFGIASLACVVIGLGLFFRSRAAWYALLVFLGVGVVLPAVSAFDSELVAARGFAFPIFGSVLNGIIAAGIYFAMRPAFAHAKGQRGPDQAVKPSDGSGGS